MMSEDESSDGMEELKELMAVYAKQEEKNVESNNSIQEKKNLGQVELNYVEAPMEKVIFGDKQKLISNLGTAVAQKLPKDASDNTEHNATSKKRLAVWTDSDDEEFQVGDVKRRTRYTGPLNHLRKDKSYKDYLTARFERTTTQPNWANPDSQKKNTESDDSDDEQLLKTVGFVDHEAKSGELRAQSLHFKRVKDLNRTTYSEGKISSVQFHPTSTAALVAGDNCIATIYTVDGQKNEKLHSMRFRNFPLTCARISPCGTKAYFGSHKPFYFSYDLIEAKETKLKLPRDFRSFFKFEISPCGKFIAVAGKFGSIHLLTTNSNELLHSFKQEGKVKSLCFTADSQRLLCSGSSCNVNILSLRQNSIEHTFLDDGCIKGQVVQLAPNQRLLATGSNEGVVNVYDYESIYKTNAPVPEKRLMNLCTSISDIRFNHTSELMAMCSREAPDAVKVAHFPSATIYANFPGLQARIGQVNTIEFSPNSAFLAFGNKAAKVPLFRLKHFRNY